MRVTQYNNLSISATVTFTASSQNVGLYAHPIDGYAYQAQETIFVSENVSLYLLGFEEKKKKKRGKIGKSGAV